MWLKLASILEKILGVVDLNNGQSEGGENYEIDNGKESEELFWGKGIASLSCL